MATVVPNTLSQASINYFLNNSATENAKESIKKLDFGKVPFTVSITPEIKAELYDKLGLDIKDITTVPMRWVKGDTAPHIDTGVEDFENTYLVYITDSPGQFIVDTQSYSITSGYGYVFAEGLSHETVGTESIPRLLLGPMSELGVAVGAPTTISADGQTETIYIRYDVDSGTTYKINNGDYIGISLPLTIVNTNTSFTLQVLFETDIVLQTDIWYIICGSANIQFGSTSLKTDGTRSVITIDGVTNYPGLIKNGDSITPGFSNIYVYNLEVSISGSSTLALDNGWIGQAYFGNQATDNYIVNCFSSGDIPENGGGIVGKNAGSGSGATLYIRGCSSSGQISISSGGIVGSNGGSDGGSVTCEQCWSTGSIGDDAGGIFSREAGTAGQAVADKCYSTGLIAGYAGGIFGSYAGTNGLASAERCYSIGAIDLNGGGIFGGLAGFNGGTTLATNCYSNGTLASVGNGIYGSDKEPGAQTVNCYSSEGNWSDTDANQQLQGFPSSPNKVGSVWVSTDINQPYELNAIGYTPYSLTIINSSSQLVQLFSQTIQAGESTLASILADASGNNVQILQINNNIPSSYNTISINQQTGAISTTSQTSSGTYDIIIRSVGSYNITIFGLTIIGGGSAPIQLSIPPCCQPICPQFNQTTNNTQQQLAVKQSATAIASNVDSTYLAINQSGNASFSQPAFKSYRDYMLYLQSKYR